MIKILSDKDLIIWNAEPNKFLTMDKKTYKIVLENYNLLF